jgi:hypothetical protein
MYLMEQAEICLIDFSFVYFCVEYWGYFWSSARIVSGLDINSKSRRLLTFGICTDVLILTSELTIDCSARSSFC